MIVKKRLSKLYTRIYKYIQSLLDKKRLASAGKKILEMRDLHNPFFMVGVPGSLHIMDLCLHYVPRNINMVLILNGMDQWEQEWAKHHFSNYKMVVTDRMLAHGKILDMLFDHFDKPFGILDYDCFVFNPNDFFRIQALSPDRFLNAFFIYKNPILGLEFPETFFLFFNTSVIISIKRRFAINSDPTTFDQLSIKVKNQLSKIDIDRDHYPEEYKKHFDTLRLLMATGLSEGYKFEFIEQYPAGSVLNQNIFHVGGVARPNLFKGSWQVRGSYFWRRLLEACDDEQLKKHYEDEFGIMTSKDVLDHHPESREKIGKEFIEFVEDIIQKAN